VTKKTPYPFQRIGARKIQKFHGRALLADAMGLGKTLQALLWLKWYLGRGPVVIVTPSTIKEVWRREIADMDLDMSVKVLEGRKPPPSGLRVSPDRIYIVNYDILGKPDDPDSWCNYLKKVQPRLVIGDEVHYVKSKDALRTKSFRHLCDGVKHVVLISGTPMTNRPAELWPALNILHPETFDSFYSFGSRYCNPRRTPWGWVYNGAANLEELHDILNETCMIRRLKEDVLRDLPTKTRSVVPMKISRPKEYLKAETDFIKWLRKYSKTKADRAMKAEKLVQMGYLKRLAAELKLPSVVDWIQNFLEESDDKLIVFGVHRIVLKSLQEKFKNISVLVDGSVTGPARQASIDGFNQNPKRRLFLGNVQAAGVGWSCTSASTTAFVEFPWTPGEMIQAEDRIHGIGRGTGEPATFYNLVAGGTIEEKLIELLAQKQLTLDQTMDGSAGASGFDLMEKLAQSLIRKQ